MFGLLVSWNQSGCATPPCSNPPRRWRRGDSVREGSGWSVDSSHSLQLDHLGVGKFLAILAPVLALQREGVRIDVSEDVGGRRLLPILEGGGCLDDPLLAVPRPGALAKAAGRVEGPRPDALGRRVPANPVRDTADGDILERGRERCPEEVLVVGPGNREPFHAALLRLTGPGADCPLQPAQMLLVAGGEQRRS